MKKPNQINCFVSQSEIQYLINDWLAKEEKQSQLDALMSKECNQKMKSLKQSKHLKQMSDKLNKIQRQLMREENGTHKQQIDKSCQIGNLYKLLRRANQWFINSKKSKVYLSQVQAQVSSIYNSGAELLEKKSKNEILLQQLKQKQIQIQGQITQSKSRRIFFERILEVQKIEHKIKIETQF